MNQDGLISNNEYNRLRAQPNSIASRAVQHYAEVAAQKVRQSIRSGQSWKVSIEFSTFHNGIDQPYLEIVGVPGMPYYALRMNINREGQDDMLLEYADIPDLLKKTLLRWRLWGRPLINARLWPGVSRPTLARIVRVAEEQDARRRNFESRLWNEHVDEQTSKFQRNTTRHHQLSNIPYGDAPFTNNTARFNVFLQEEVDPSTSVYIVPDLRKDGAISALYNFTPNGIAGALQQPSPVSPISGRPFGHANLRRVRSKRKTPNV